jgi:Zn-dependent protease
MALTVSPDDAAKTLSSLSPTIVRQCPNCGQELPLGAMACQQCHTLIHARELDELSRRAKDLEGKSQFLQARDAWNRCLTLLPHDSKQAEWIKDHLKELESAQSATPDPAAKPDHAWARKLGPLGPIAILLVKSKGLLLAIFKLKFLFSFLSFFALYAALFGWQYGAGIAVSILVHEMGHFIDIKRRGLPAEMPVFLPGLGAYVKWNALGVTLRQKAQISLAGPLAGWIAAAGCYLIYTHTHEPIWAALARTGAMLNVLNLIPVWILDGGKAADALGLVERTGLLAAALALWLFSGESLFFLVAAGVGWRLFTKDKPVQDDWSTWLYYVALLVALAVVLHAVPAESVNKAALPYRM